jgi:hypothetical protein
MYKCESFAKLLTWHKDGASLDAMICSVPNFMIWKHIDEKWLELLVMYCGVTFRPSTPSSTRWLCQSTFAINEGKNASIILNARLHL